MTRNTFFAAIVFAAMAIVPNTTMADNHGHHNNGNGYSIDLGAARDTRGGYEARPGNYNMDRPGNTGYNGYNGNHNGNYNGNYNSNYNSNYNGNYNSNYNGNYNSNYNNRPGNMGYNNHAGHHDGWREMHGHRWNHDGWMEGYHGRVRHFDDGRWGYLRDGRWYYYNRFIEPDYYYAHPCSHFHSYSYTKAEKAAIGITVGAVAVAALIGALAR